MDITSGGVDGSSAVVMGSFLGVVSAACGRDPIPPCEDDRMRAEMDPPTIPRLPILPSAAGPLCRNRRHGCRPPRCLPPLARVGPGGVPACGRPSYGEVRDGGYEFPVAELRVRYLQPARFDDLVNVHLAILAARGASFEIGYLVSVDGEACLRGATRHAVLGPAGRPVRCPEWLVALVDQG